MLIFNIDMCISVNIYKYICLFHIYVYIYVYLLYMHIYLYIYIYISLCIQIYLGRYKHMHIWTHVHENAHPYMHTLTQNTNDLCEMRMVLEWWTSPCPCRLEPDHVILWRWAYTHIGTYMLYTNRFTPKHTNVWV